MSRFGRSFPMPRMRRKSAAVGATTFNVGPTSNDVSIGSSVVPTIIRQITDVGVGSGSVGGVSNSFEGGTNATAMTTVNSGGASGSAFDQVFNSTGASTVYDSANAAHGGMAVKQTAGSGGGSSFSWLAATLGTMSDGYGRDYVKSAFAEQITVASGYLSGAWKWGITVTATRTVKILDGAGGTQATSTTVVTSNAYFRVEWHHNATGQLVVNLYTTPDATTPTETLTAAANTASNIDEIRFGGPGSAAGDTLYHDDVLAGATGWPGPVGSTLSGVTDSVSVTLGKNIPVTSNDVSIGSSVVKTETPALSTVGANIGSSVVPTIIRQITDAAFSGAGGNAATLVQTFGANGVSGSTSTLVINVPAGGTTAGNTLFLVASGAAQAITGIADSKGNPWSLDDTAANGTVVNGALASCHLTTALVSGDTITVTYNALTGGRSATIGEYSGVAAASYVDTAAFGTATVTGTSLAITGAAATTNANDLVIAGYAFGANVSPSVTSGGFTIESTAASAGTIRATVLADLAVTTTGTQSVTLSWTGGTQTVGIIGAYKASAGGGGLSDSVSATKSAVQSYSYGVSDTGATISSSVARTLTPVVSSTGATIGSAIAILVAPTGISSTGATISSSVVPTITRWPYARGFYGSVGPGIAIRGTNIQVDDATGLGELATIEPATIQGGDLLVTIVFTGNAANTATITFLGGSSQSYSYATAQALAYNTASPLTGAAVFYRYARSTEATENGGLPNQESWQLSDTTVPWGALLVVLSGVDKFTPLDVSAPSLVLPSAPGTAVSFPGVTPVDYAGYLLLLAGIRTNNTAGTTPTWTAPSAPISLPKLADSYSAHSGSNNAGGVAFGAEYDSTRPTGTPVATSSISVSWVGATLLLKAAEGDPGSVGIARVRVIGVTSSDTNIGTGTVQVLVARPITQAGATIGSSVAITAAPAGVTSTGATIGDSVVTTRVPAITSTGATISSSVAPTIIRQVSDTGAIIGSSVVPTIIPSITSTGSTVGSSVTLVVGRFITSTGATIGDSPATSTGGSKSVTDAGSAISSSVSILVAPAGIASTGTTIGSSVVPTIGPLVSSTGATIGSSVVPTITPAISSSGATIASSAAITVSRPISSTGATVGSSIASQRVAFGTPSDTGASVSSAVTIIITRPVSDTGATITSSVALVWTRGPVDSAFSLISVIGSTFQTSLSNQWGVIVDNNLVGATGWTIDAGTSSDFNVSGGVGATVVMGAGSTHRIVAGANLKDVDILTHVKFPTATAAGTGYQVAIGARSQNSGTPQNELRGTITLNSSGHLIAQVGQVVAGTFTALGTGGGADLGAYTAGDDYAVHLVVAGNPSAILIEARRVLSGALTGQWADMGIARGTAAGWTSGDLNFTFTADASAAGTTVTIPGYFARQPSITDTVTRFATGGNITDGVNIFDSVAITVAPAGITSTGATVASSVASSANRAVTASGTGATISSSVARGVGRAVTSSDVSISDSISRAAAFVRSASDIGASISDSVRGFQPMTPVDIGVAGLAITDTFTRLTASELGVSDSGDVWGDYLGFPGTGWTFLANGSQAFAHSSAANQVQSRTLPSTQVDGDWYGDVQFSSAAAGGMQEQGIIFCAVAGGTYFRAQVRQAATGANPVSLRVESSRSGGVLIGSAYTLTGADPVANAYTIHVQKRGRSINANAYMAGTAEPSGWQVSGKANPDLDPVSGGLTGWRVATGSGNTNFAADTLDNLSVVYSGVGSSIGLVVARLVSSVGATISDSPLVIPPVGTTTSTGATIGSSVTTIRTPLITSTGSSISSSVTAVEAGGVAITVSDLGVQGGSILDTFNRVSASELGTADTGQAWSDQFGFSGIGWTLSVSGGTARAAPTSANMAQSRGMTLSQGDGEWFMDVGWTSAPAGGGQEQGIIFNHDGTNYFRAQIRQAVGGANPVSLRVESSRSGGQLLGSFVLTGADPVANMYRIHVLKQGTTIRANAWQAGTAELAGWQVTATPNVLDPVSGKTGWRVATLNGNTSLGVALMDNFQIVGPGVASSVAVTATRPVTDTSVSISSTISAVVRTGARAVSDTGATITSSVQRVAQLFRPVTSTDTNVDSTVGVSVRSAHIAVSVTSSDVAISDSVSVHQTAISAAVTSTGATITSSVQAQQTAYQRPVSDTGAAIGSSVALRLARAIPVTSTGVTITSTVQAAVRRLVSSVGVTITSTTSGARPVPVASTGATITSSIGLQLLRGVTSTDTTISDSVGGAGRLHVAVTSAGAAITSSVAAAIPRAVLAVGATITSAILRQVTVGVATTGAVINSTVDSHKAHSRAVADTGATIASTVRRAVSVHVASVGATVTSTIAPSRVRIAVVTSTGAAISSSVTPRADRAVTVTTTGASITSALRLATTRRVSSVGSSITSTVAMARNVWEPNGLGATITSKVTTRVLHIRAITSTGATITSTTALRHLTVVPVTSTGTVVGSTVAAKAGRRVASVGVTISSTVTRTSVHGQPITSIGTTITTSVRTAARRSIQTVGATITSTLALGTRRPIISVGAHITTTIGLHLVTFRAVSTTGAHITSTVTVYRKRPPIILTSDPSTVTLSNNPTSGLSTSGLRPKRLASNPHTDGLSSNPWKGVP